MALIDRYKNVNILNLSGCRNIKDFTPISKIERLKILNVNETYISDISFLEKNKYIIDLNLFGCKNIKDFKPISRIERLEILDVCYTNICNISFLEKNKNIKKLRLIGCKNINKNNNIFNRKDICIYMNKDINVNF